MCLVYRLEIQGGGIFRADYVDKDGIEQHGVWFNAIGCPDVTEIHPTPSEDDFLADQLIDYLDEYDELGSWRHHEYYQDKRIFKLDSALLFGFLDKRQYLRWVYDPEWRHLLTDHGVELVVYQVDEDHVCEGDAQIVFNSHRASVVDRLKPNHFDI